MKNWIVYELINCFKMILKYNNNGGKTFSHWLCMLFFFFFSSTSSVQSLSMPKRGQFTFAIIPG